ncbi:hypothetical protein HAX54_017412 [Datura stramonium]|uniref:Uncharacterized protein n=1 Tax=Datura stramonium TaxID=4076 RepID=A0ABS8UKM5_DATST|nr:hypothetical protein [Datura stramonium]
MCNIPSACKMINIGDKDSLRCSKHTSLDPYQVHPPPKVPPPLSFPSPPSMEFCLSHIEEDGEVLESEHLACETLKGKPLEGVALGKETLAGEALGVIPED